MNVFIYKWVIFTTLESQMYLFSKKKKTNIFTLQVKEVIKNTLLIISFEVFKLHLLLKSLSGKLFIHLEIYEQGGETRLLFNAEHEFKNKKN